MIVDRLEHADLYHALSPRLAQAFDYMRRTDFSQVGSGRHAVDGDRLIAIVERYDTKLDEKAVWESHRKYVDVQFMVNGRERFGLATPAESLPVREPYLDARDVQFYEPGSRYLTVDAGTFLVFFPQDIHAPGLAPVRTPGAPPTPGPVVKVVMKVLWDPSVAS